MSIYNVGDKVWRADICDNGEIVVSSGTVVEVREEENFLWREGEPETLEIVVVEPPLVDRHSYYGLPAGEYCKSREEALLALAVRLERQIKQIESSHRTHLWLLQKTRSMCSENTKFFWALKQKSEQIKSAGLPTGESDE